MRVDSVQFQHRAGDVHYNFRQVEKHTRLAAGENSQLIVFPECCLTGYWHLRNLSRDALFQLAESAAEGPLCGGDARHWEIRSADRNPPRCPLCARFRRSSLARSREFVCSWGPHISVKSVMHRFYTYMCGQNRLCTDSTPICAVILRQDEPVGVLGDGPRSEGRPHDARRVPLVVQVDAVAARLPRRVQAPRATGRGADGALPLHALRRAGARAGPGRRAGARMFEARRARSWGRPRVPGVVVVGCVLYSGALTRAEPVQGEGRS